MKRQIVMALGLAYFGLPVLAIAAPNFSGSWMKDNSKSDPVPNPLMLREAPQGRGGGGGRGGPGRGGGPMPMVVTQDANSLQVTEPQGGMHKYMLDGKSHAAVMETGVQKAAVTAAWEGDTLVISSTEPYGGMPGNVTAHIKEMWSLSPDGKTLTISTTRSMPAIEKSFKEVYSRQ
jgi:WD40-like Beta Propeller Repeat